LSFSKKKNEIKKWEKRGKTLQNAMSIKKINKTRMAFDDWPGNWTIN
jgi:hypothetical protein